MFNDGAYVSQEAGVLRVKIFGAEGIRLSASASAIASTQPLALYCVVQLEKQQVAIHHFQGVKGGKGGKGG